MLTRKYKNLIRHVEKRLVDEDVTEFKKFLNEINLLERAALDAAETLDEVRTGEDFECDCGDKASAVRKALGIKGEFDNE